MLIDVKNKSPGSDKKGQLPKAEVKVNDIPVNALIDSGCVGDFISVDFVKKYGIKMYPTDPKVLVTATKTNSYSSLLGQISVNFRYQHINEDRKIGVLDLNTQDLILGIPFLEDHQPEIDWISKSLKFSNQDKKKTYNELDKEVNLQTSKRKSVDYIKDIEDRKRIEDLEHVEKGNSGNNEIDVNLIEFEVFEKEIKRNNKVELVMINELKEKVEINHLDNNFGKVEDQGYLVGDGKLKELIHKYDEVFPVELPKELPPRRLIEHEIKVDSQTKPPSKPPYRLSFIEQEELKKQLQILSDSKLIRPSASPFGSPVLFAKKKSGELRMCVDFRALNNITVKNRYPLPRIDDMLDQLSNATVFSKLDLTSGYWQVRVKDEDIAKTAFTTKYGHYEFMVMPFGLCNAPATFQYLMNSIFQEFLDKFVVVYLDDIMVYSRNIEEHLHHLELVFKKLKENRLYVKLKKCEFLKSSVEYLGHIVGNNSIKPDTNKVEAIQQWPVPKDSKEVMSFMGLANFYRKFVKDFSNITVPLTNIMGKKSKFYWGNDQEIAFKQIKEALSSQPVLKLPSRLGRFRVHTDASEYAIGAVLEQEDLEYKNIKPVAYFSMKLHGAQVRYATHIKELYAIVKSLENWRQYLEGSQFDVFTDHYSLQFLRSQPSLTKLQARWVEKLSEFDFQLFHKPGRTNVVADALSRKPQINFIDLARISVGLQDKLKVEYLEDGYFKEIYNRLRSGNSNEDESIKHYKIINDILIYSVIIGDEEERVCLPKGEVRNKVLFDYHDSKVSGHMGFIRTYEIIHRYFYWPGMGKEIKNYVKRCTRCQQIKSSNQRPQGLLQPLQIPNRKWQRVSMDFIVHLPITKNGFDSIWVVVDYLSKRAHLIPTRTNVNAKEVAKLYIENIFKLHGVPDVIVSDRDSKFISSFWKSFHSIMGTKLALSTANHAQTDGQTERINRTLEQILRLYVNSSHDDWDSILPFAEFAYNDTVSAATGLTPFEIDTGQHPSRTGFSPQNGGNRDAKNFVDKVKVFSNIAKDAIQKSQEYQVKYANQYRREVQFKIGDFVMVHKSAFTFNVPKLGPVWFGPYKVLDRYKTSFRLAIPKESKMHPVVHASHLKLHYNPISTQPHRTYQVHPVRLEE